MLQSTPTQGKLEHCSCKCAAVARNIAYCLKVLTSNRHRQTYNVITIHASWIPVRKPPVKESVALRG